MFFLDPSLLDAVQTAQEATSQAVALTGGLPTATNPFPAGPNWGIFGPMFDAWWKKLFGGAWAIAFIIAGFNLIVGLVAVGKNDEDNPHQTAAGKKKAKFAALSLVGLAGLAVILGFLLSLAPGDG